MLFDPRFLITLYRCSYSSFPPLGCAFGFWFRRPSFWGCQTHGARNTTKLCTGARSMDSFISFHNQTIRIQQSWTNNHGFVSAFRNFNPFRVSNIRDPSTKAHLSQAIVQDLFETSRIHWQSVISPMMLQMLEGIHWNPLFSAFGGSIPWCFTLTHEFSYPNPPAKAHIVCFSIGVPGTANLCTLKVQSPGIMVTFAEMNNTRWYNWTSMKIIEHQVWDLPFSKLGMPASAAHQLAVSSSVNPGFVKVDRGSCEIDMRQSS